MLRFHSSFDGKRFVGDNKKMIFHDSQNEASPAAIGSCQIDRIAPVDIVLFDPDSPAEAIIQGFAPCMECLWTESSLHE